MNRKILFAAVSCLIMALLVCACGKTPAEKTGAPGVDISESDGAESAASYEDMLAELGALDHVDDDTYVRNALNADAFGSLLRNGKDSALR